ncbi:hypothetical protein [Rhodoflexus caldus]|uniref:hypothetical protein n=1 Tax=Rhodoflexus caldus TaxID=2891236 RepID=UPI00202A09D2|nr:hypothetical protein [Rhodoflexus caldus]
MSSSVMAIPAFDSSSARWIEWHKALKKAVGKDEANALFIEAWELRVGKQAGNADSDLRGYMRSQGVEMAATRWEKLYDSASTGFDFLAKIGITVGTGVLIFRVVIPAILSLVFTYLAIRTSFRFDSISAAFESEVNRRLK